MAREKGGVAAVATAPEGLLDDSLIEVGDAVRIGWMRVLDAVLYQADGNPKLHDIEGLARVFMRDGFTDPPKWDSNLNDGQGGFVFGNGRLEALAWLEEKHRADPEACPKPRGIGTERGSGAWVLPIKLGVDASSQFHAQQQLIDHNSLNLAGGEFDSLEMARLYDSDAYLAILAQIGEGAEEAGVDLGGALTETVSFEDFTLLTQIASQVGGPLEFQAPGGISLGDTREGGFSEGQGDEEGGQGGDLPPEAGVRMLQLFLDTETHPEIMAYVEALNPVFGTKNPTDCILHAMRHTRQHFNQNVEDGDA